jgi:hypothetical protein
MTLLTEDEIGRTDLEVAFVRSFVADDIEFTQMDRLPLIITSTMDKR